MQRRDFLKTVLASATAIVVSLVPRSEPRPPELIRVPACQLAIYGSPSFPFSSKVPKPSEPPTGILLATLRLVPREASRTKVALEAASPAIAVASGMPDYFRLVHLGQTILQGTCGVYSGDLRFSGLIVLGGTVCINDFTVRRI